MHLQIESRAESTDPRYKPWGVIGLSVISTIIFFGVNLEPARGSWEAFNHWGVYDEQAIWNGKLWPLLTSNFVHVEVWHIAFNLYWLWILGKKIEFEKGVGFLLLIVLSAGLMASLFELTVASETGIGLSGIVYAFFGYILVRSRYSPAFANFLRPSIIILFVAWIPVGFLMTYADVFRIGNVAHLSGLLWGGALAWCETFNTRHSRLAIPTGILLLSFGTLYWSPWSVGWLRNRAYALHSAERLDEAMEYYDRILEDHPADTFALENRKMIVVYELSQKAVAAYSHDSVAQAREMYKQILSVDPVNQWAKKNLTRLGDTLATD